MIPCGDIHHLRLTVTDVQRSREFYTGLGDDYRKLQPDELLTRVFLPESAADYRGVYRKLVLRENKVLTGHAMRNALIPVVTIVALQVPGGFGGAGVLEVISDHDGDTFRAVYTVRFAGAV